MVEQHGKLTLLKDSVQRLSSVFKTDLLLIAKSAQKHKIRMTSDGIIALPEGGAYNLRIPSTTEEELTKLMYAQRIVVGCMDYRQSAEIVDETGADAWILMAGGGAQPEKRRLDALTDLLATIATVNPHVTFTLLAHDRICGGVNHFTKGKITGMTPDQEAGELSTYLGNLTWLLGQNGVNESRFKTGIVQIGQNNEYLRVKYL